MHARQRVTRSSFTHPLLPIVAPHPLPALPERSWSAEACRYKKADDEYDGVLLELVLASYVLGESAPELRARFQEVSSR
ncbi:hypothetical protein EV644_11321 [Kribbella orskensis]|uniref:Uncharacterized protein n=1 Tax=Kribbella orskensis TaxID=2512216 RepID=A0ABY2BEI5_9ACTN|nr:MULTISPECIES: hypothetical protein [Kribbella]TCN36552.1 hypothetical protein EV642_11420 [Kribbella sp. VKM Ac-2500]TCO17791.1 hypothetical protein EV644_11321 [Kribbella orskensis]